MMFNLALAVITGLAVVVAAFSLGKRNPRRLPLPPGPRPLPVIGNLHQAPTICPWRVFQQWGKQYGPIFKLQFAQNTIIMLLNHQTAHDLLDKKSGIYSSRPQVVMAAECFGRGMLTLLMPYGPRWRPHQRLQMSCLNIRASQTYCRLQELESKQLVYDMLSTNDFTDGFRRYAAGLVFALAYGRLLDRLDCVDLKELDEIVENTLQTLQPGWIVDLILILNYLPSWLAPWKRYTDKLCNFESRIYLKNFTDGLASPSWNWSKQVHRMADGQMSLLELAYDVGIVWEAQAQLDEVVGPDRLPTFADKEHIPYIYAILQEVLRWRPVAAGGVPHAVTEDDEYMGYLIPKGSTIIANQWAICHGESVFPNPETFDPERWIQNPNLPVAAFSHGRRTCFCQHIARNSLFIIIAHFLWAFDIECTVVDKNEEKVRQVPNPLAMTQGFNSKPMPFKVEFKARTPRVVEVIRKEWVMKERDINVILERVEQDQAAQRGKVEV
ncbi:hypothetical protein G7Y89_g1167 [Cudoniella acicularis]|uniref:Cytochrome P450 n=1 Tax=Cudoniella acicularis TaxID=354080 RepID=A0A8H4WAJ3_9HELO|nr:hypothetical protein G7Y89_g1167 [Cudoniella acicularis]